MGDGDGRAARDYHERTKHSVASLQRSRHVLDWENQPIPYKIYVDLPAIPLPREIDDLATPALAAIAGDAAPGHPPGPIDLPRLARLLMHAAGVVRKVTYAGERTMYFRAAACTGALYHIDLYVVCGALPDLEAGVYHFSPHDFALRRLRAGDHRAAVIAAAGGEPALATAPVALVCASTFWRNAWKYQARAYRHAFWDTGTILANLLAVGGADGVPARVVLGFVDAAVNGLVGIDGEREAAIALVALGAGAAPPPAAPPAPALALATAPLSAREVHHPAIAAVHAASALATPADVAAWRGEAPAARRGPAAAADAAGILLGGEVPPSRPVTSVIRRRGSTRVFARDAIASAELAAVLRAATAAIPADVPAPSAAAAIDAYLIVNAVDGVPSGTYVLAPERDRLLRLQDGDHRRAAGHLDLGQDLAADASVNVYLLTDLAPWLARFGDRGYRAAQLLAAIVGGRMYLAAYGLGLGATGLTFFDDDVTAFFAPHAAGKSVLFLVALGRPKPRR